MDAMQSQTSMLQAKSRQSKKTDAAAAFQHVLTPRTSAPKENRSYKCSYCNTTFRRSEHCIRHERSHTLEKPFGCAVCGCRFARKDLLVRHERTVHSSSRTMITASTRPDKRQRTDSGPQEIIELAIRPAALPNQQTVPEGCLNVDPIPSRGSECVLGLSPAPSGQIEQHDRRSSIISNHEWAQPLTPPVSDSSDYAPQRRASSPVIDDNGDVGFADTNFTTLFPTIEMTDDGALASSPLGLDVFSSAISAIHCSFAELATQFPEFYTPDNILGDVSTLESSITGLFQDVGADGMAPTEEFHLSQVPSTRLRGRRETDASDSSNHSFISSLAQKRAPSILIDETTRDWLMQDMAASYPRDLLNGFRLPNSHALQRYLDSYFASFHKNFPILHLPTFYPKRTKALLLLSVCCIGAQYCLEKRRARYLFDWTKRFLIVEDVKWRRVQVEGKAWLIRSKILLGFFGIWSAERELVCDALTEQSSLAGYFRSAQSLLLRREEIPLQQQTWRDWVDIESFKRLCYGIYVLQSVISIIFNLSPGISCSDIHLPLPAAEELWEASDAEAWELDLKTSVPGPKFQDALEYYFGANSQGSSPSSESSPTAFGGLLLVYGLMSQQWQVAQCRQSLPLFGFTMSTVSATTIVQDCKNLLGCFRDCLVYTHQNSSSTAGGSLWFVAAGLLRQASIRQFTQFDQASLRMRTIIRPDEASVDIDAVVAYVVGGMERSSAATRAAEMATECLEMPIRAGHFMVCKTAALTWSIDHIVAGWDCILFLIRWMFTLETVPANDWGPEEIRVYKNLGRLMEETDLDLDVCAASLAATWGDLLKDTWVWGIAPALGNAMRTLSERLRSSSEGF